MLEATTYEQAVLQNREVLGKGLSRQSWAIVPKIREVDSLLRSDSRARRQIRECHPEVCFWGLAGKPMRDSKKKREGFNERMAVLEAELPGARDLAAAAFLEHGGFEVARDDIVDALVAALCALHAEECRTLPETPEVDDCGLPMEMVYLPASAVSKAKAQP